MSDILIYSIIGVGILACLIAMYKKGIRPNSPLARLLKKDSRCNSKNCNQKLELQDLNSSYCYLHQELIQLRDKYNKEIKRSKTSKIQIKKIEEFLKKDTSELSKQQIKRWTEFIKTNKSH